MADESELREHFARVSEIYDRIVGTRPSPNLEQVRSQANIETSLGQRATGAFEHFLQRLAADPARVERFEANPEVARWAVDLFEHSPFFADELIRTPELAEELGRKPLEEPPPMDLDNLRRWYRREMLRIQAESICRSHPIFETLEQTSDLADRVIARVYDVSVRETAQDAPPTDPAYRASNQMWVIALGRLGTREFDLGSDADLVFVVADTDAHELAFWTRVAERMVVHITAYTGLGVLFAVDTRLRPNGNAGPLVATETTYREYFKNTAEAWEGITYMKSRAVAGDPVRAEAFLHELQAADWVRYGLGGRSRGDLLQMRMRLEREQGASHPLKAGRGGYYDIDFILMYLRLKSAGVYFKVLNTPERLSVLENLELIHKGQAEFLLRAATAFIARWIMGFAFCRGTRRGSFRSLTRTWLRWRNWSRAGLPRRSPRCGIWLRRLALCLIAPSLKGAESKRFLISWGQCREPSLLLSCFKSCKGEILRRSTASFRSFTPS